MLGSQPIPAGLYPVPPRAVPNAPLHPGTIVGGRYKIESRIGEGGMGYVVRARHLELDTLVAIKIVRPELAKNADAGERLLEESRAMASIHSDYIVGVQDAGRLPDGSLYLVLELVDGPDLDQVITAQGHLSSADTIAFALDACAGLGVAHERGIVHRDIKPENLLLSTDGNGLHRIKISDFGIAKRTARIRERALTIPTMALGSPCYMAPEQMRNASDIDGRADIWSLGVVLYEMCTGVIPFNASSPLEICTMVMTASPRPPSEVRPGVVDGLERVINGCLQRDPQDRYQTVQELAHALSLVEVASGTESRRLVSGLVPYDKTPLTGAQPAPVAPRPSGRVLISEPLFDSRITLITNRMKVRDRASDAPHVPALPVTEHVTTSRRGRLAAPFAVFGTLAVLGLAAIGLAMFAPAAVSRSLDAVTSTVVEEWRRYVSEPAGRTVSGSEPTSAHRALPTPAPVHVAPVSPFDVQADALVRFSAEPAWTMPLEEAAVAAPVTPLPSHGRYPTTAARPSTPDAYAPEAAPGHVPATSPLTPSEAAGPVETAPSPIHEAPAPAPQAPAPVQPAPVNVLSVTTP
jgi:serine/threonine protein kinase